MHVTGCNFCVHSYTQLIELSQNLTVLLVFQATVEQQKFHGRGNIKSPRKPYPVHHRTGPKHGPNGVPPFPVPLSYYAPAVPPVFHTMVPMPPISNLGSAYPFPPRPFPRVDTQFVKSGRDAPLQVFVPPANGVVQPSSCPDPSAHDSNSVGRMPDAKEQVGQRTPSWNNQRPVAISNNFHFQQTMGPRFFIRHPYFDPAGFIDGQHVTGTSIITYLAVLVNENKYSLHHHFSPCD